MSDSSNAPRHSADGPREADRCEFCVFPRQRCEQSLERDLLRQPCCVNCSHGGRVIVHRLPPNGVGLTPCCGKTPFELPRTDQITAQEKVTCKGPEPDVRAGSGAQDTKP